MRDEHRHVLAVGGFEEELFGSVLRRIVGHLRRMVAGGAARGDVIAVDGRRRGEGVEREENLLLPVLAAETRHRTDGRQRHVGLPVALVIVFVDLVLRVPEVFHPQVSPARSDRFEQIVGVLRDDGLQPPGFEQIDARQPIVGRTVVGHDIEFVVALAKPASNVRNGSSLSAGRKRTSLPDVPSDARTKSQRPSSLSQPLK